MIVKINDGHSWHIFDEADHLSWSRFDIDNKDAPRAVNAIDLISTVGGPDIAERGCVEIQFINKNQTLPNYVYARCPVYLLNNEGKTIEVINY